MTDADSREPDEVRTVVWEMGVGKFAGVGFDDDGSRTAERGFDVIGPNVEDPFEILTFDGEGADATGGVLSEL